MSCFIMEVYLVQVAGITNRGCVREINEDSIFMESSLYIVADGMGGHLAGEVASKEAIICLKKYLLGKEEENIPDLLKEAVKQANKQIYEMSIDKEEYKGMGTTVTLAMLFDDELFFAHVGDSRLYRYSQEYFEQMTTDHSLVAQMVETGQITEEEANTHPSKNIITKAVGTGIIIEPDIGSFKLKKGDIILLCSDGLTNMLTNEQIVDILNKYKDDLDKVVAELLEKANDAGGNDNISIICLQY